MHKSSYILFACIALICSSVIAVSCRKHDKQTSGPTPITFTVPAGWPQPQYNFAQNPLTEEGFALGKKIFFDNKLSSDEQVACANCHQPFASFVQFDHDLSHGVNNQHTTRASQPLVNLAWHKEFTWDGAASHLEVQPLAPFTAPNEMNLTIAQVLDKIKANPTYTPMYKSAFGDDIINTERTMKALAQYMLMLVSSNSKYDKVKKGTASFSSLEDLGYQVFKSKCNSCHVEPLFTDLSYRSIGLTKDATLNDNGRMKVTLNRQDSLKFKVPTLRNAALTYPYTHDGRYYTLERMIDHYRNDVVLDFSTDAIVRHKLNISITERSALVAFIHTLTDTTFTKNPKFGL
jgi:cytochrome c peroxidase